MIDIGEARELIDFSGDNVPLELAEKQLQSTVSLYNMIQAGGLGYLADEVGMGKTYVALGVVSLMRYINPNLKVLYILPKQNVLDKWKTKEYPSFLEGNFKVENHKVKSFDGKPASLQVECKNLIDLIKYSSAGYYGDFFIKMSSFSFPLSGDGFNNKLNDLKKLIPSAVLDFDVNDKDEVKLQYSKNINKILPFFDLVIIDESHNFRKSMGSSNRNEYMSIILGTNKKYDTIKKINNVLLLSATPFDRDIQQLINQLELVGMDKYANELRDVKNNREETIKILEKFMSRRLNNLKIGEETYTRNQYRVERREEAAIKIEQIDKKLIVALVQKKVGELLDDDKFKGQFQTGMLASFESYLPSSKKIDITIEPEFDATQDGDIKSAVDNGIIKHLHDSYTKRFNQTSLPHPKMDSVVQEYANDSFTNGKKHIIFVRRIQSVTDLKTKFDKYYDEWLEAYLIENIKRNKQEVKTLLVAYKNSKISKKSDVDGDNPFNTFFTYYFRGTNYNKKGAPSDISERLSSIRRNDSLINTFEINWFHALKKEASLDDLLLEVKKFWKEKSSYYKEKDGYKKLTNSEKFHIIQISYLNIVGEHDKSNYYKKLYNILEVENKIDIDVKEITNYLEENTFFSNKSELFINDFLYSNNIEKIDFITKLISSTLRLGHGIIDMFIAYTNSQDRFLDAFEAILKKQKIKNTKFSTYKQIYDVLENIDLIIRNNFAQFERQEKTYNQFLSDVLSPLEAIAGARGGSGKKSVIARKFRMPGYPMILISTDVLQEGEDLHTFCDSVVHYGLANTPIAIEQKNGRVDRIGSLGQRNLQSKKEIQEDDKLKVSFPFLKETVEVVQIHNLAHNLNDFITSIDSFESQKVNINNDANDLISSIPRQYTGKLQSSFKSVKHVVVNQAASERLASIIEKDKKLVSSSLDNINELIPLGQANYNIDIARSSSEFLLHVYDEAINDIHVKFNSKQELLDYMHSRYEDIYHRTIISELSYQGDIPSCTLKNNIEILIGNKEITNKFEVDEVFERVKSTYLEDTIFYPLENLLKIATESPITEYDFIRNHHVNVNIVHIKNHIEMLFTFSQYEVVRQQKVNLSVVGAYALFTSRATEDKFIDQFDMKEIIKYTWERNGKIDIVEFVVNKENAIVGRVVFPCKYIHNKEILYNAYILACEADHLEQILHKDDRF